ncbi:fasciclin domain-containing protein [Halomonas alimentaria]|uniref:fasciclin domain-containing protein n=1 Tax=Halomonas alimentaria TaxID=147248 RepID=UPI0024936122|nr:fasciclin domain-containing protein [Halomonas alimentaria]
MIHKKMKTVGWMTSAAAGVLLSAAAQADHHGMKKDIVDTAVEAGQFETLVAAVQAADLVETLKGEGPYTVFAPTDEAFAALPEGTVESLLEEENRDQLQAILTNHVVSGKIMAEDAMAADSATTVQGQDLTITTMDGSVMIDDATVIQADIETSNGVIHVIDSVLMPE